MRKKVCQIFYLNKEKISGCEFYGLVLIANDYIKYVKSYCTLANIMLF